ncbi:MAG: hypothetical protein COX40_01950 [Candidatus Omnitrophica bacterium CG23_combo_of_CG06-09_8_20_14_all_40_11]|nr:MAG: hypothetical protein COX40_01950 [Candidatus Omnitrophica bacterium CG23_combo_of_CG06-09_8_20_14_all_40_11]
MNPLEFQLKQLIKLMLNTKTDYAVLGGIAVSIYGEPRLTFDIDVNIIVDINKINDFLKKAKKYGFLPLPSKIEKFIENTGVIPMRFSKDKVMGKCDFIIAQNPLEYSGIKRARFKKINSIKVKLISPEDLIIHKITSERPRDLEDLGGILVRQKNKLDMRYIIFWLKKISGANKKPQVLHLFRKLVAQR